MTVVADTKAILRKISNDVSEVEPNKLFVTTVDSEKVNKIFSEFFENVQ